MRHLLSCLSVLVLLLLPSLALSQERRVALVVGANAYRHVTPLSSAVADARAIASSLRDLGFEVVGGGPLLDPTRAQLTATLDRFEAALQGAALGLFFYAGHAVEVGGRNLLLPVDAPAATSERQLRADTMDAQEILADMLRRTPRAVMILDACRNNPLPRDATRGNHPVVGSERGLERIEAPPRDGGGSFVVLAAAPGEIALDRLPEMDSDPNSLFTRHLLQALADPARPLPALMGEVRDAVAAAARTANRRQLPEITDRMEGSGRVMLAAATARPLQTQPTSALRGSEAGISADELFRRAYALEQGLGVRQNDTEAVRLYRLAAGQGNADAQVNLGLMLEQGRGVARNDAEAARLYRLAADKGHTTAQYSLGWMYEQGRGVRQDRGEAIRLYQLAARQGRTDAQAALRRLGQTW